ncbi:MAG: XdhC family protein [Gemmatimonadetes bacterium]|nr:XdhC family protein [Gemmatimonadota bacterium]
MADLFDNLDGIRQSGRRTAMATLVATRGTSPRKEGARMWVNEEGAIVGSVTIGGCVDAEVVRAAEDVLRNHAPRLLTIELGDEDAHALGLTCAGAVDVLVQEVDPAAEAYDRVRAHVAGGGRAATVTLLPSDDVEAATARQRVLVVFDDGAMQGTLGDDHLDDEARARALERIRSGGSRTLTLETGGSVNAFFEVHGAGPLLVVVGAGEIAESLTLFGQALGMRVVLMDTRSRFATRERFPHADEVRVGLPSELIRSYRHGSDSAIVLVAHDYKTDLPVLEASLESAAGYIGMLGSRKRGATILRMLAESGVTQERLARIRTPIGLDIGSQTAAEIALSILAEVVAVRNGRAGGALAGTRAG